MTYGFVGEFELIKYVWSRADISEAAWAQPINREIAVKHFKVLRAREELKRLHVEMRRIREAIERENADFKSAIATLSTSDSLMAAELSSQYSFRSRVNVQLLDGLCRVEALPGYIGPSPTRSTTNTLVPPPPAPEAPGALPQPLAGTLAAHPEDQDADYDEVGEALESEGLEACLGGDGLASETNIPAHMLYQYQL